MASKTQKTEKVRHRKHRPNKVNRKAEQERVLDNVKVIGKLERANRK